MNSSQCDLKGGSPASLKRPRYLVALAVFAFALISLVPTLASASRSFLYYQSGVWINKVALTPKHRPVHVVDTGSGPLAIATADHRMFWSTVGSDATAYESSITAATARGKGVRTLVSVASHCPGNFTLT
jgi:hypothetical protein